MSLFNIESRSGKLFVFLAAFFVANALIAEFIGVKIFSLEATLGLTPLSWNFLGQEGLSMNLTAGVLLWPLIFVMTDVVNEYFGVRGVRFLSWLAAGLILYAFLAITMAISLAPADFWPSSYQDRGVPDMQAAYRVIFGQGAWIIIGSLIAFLIGQLVDALIFRSIKRFTGERALWLRATGSTFISQFLDSFVVLFVAFYLGAGWSLSLVMAIGLVNYLYKFVMAIVLTPLIYLAHWIIDRYLGTEEAGRLKAGALGVRD